MKVFESLRGNLSIEEVSIKLGVNRSTIYRIEKGETVPSLDIVLRYYKYFKPPAISFIEGLRTDYACSTV